jgi:5-(carboxyamino)imidazole ribonucleotide mutase
LKTEKQEGAMSAKIAIILGSKNDVVKLKAGFDILKSNKIAYSLDILSAHRHPEKLTAFCQGLEKKGVEVVIGCAGMAAALPGFVAALVDIPVIGVGLEGGMLGGLDSVLAIVGTPKGLGVASTGLGKSAFINAIILSLEIIALKDKKYKAIVKKVKNSFR